MQPSASGNAIFNFTMNITQEAKITFIVAGDTLYVMINKGLNGLPELRTKILIDVVL